MNRYTKRYIEDVKGYAANQPSPAKKQRIYPKVTTNVTAKVQTTHTKSGMALGFKSMNKTTPTELSISAFE